MSRIQRDGIKVSEAYNPEKMVWKITMMDVTTQYHLRKEVDREIERDGGLLYHILSVMYKEMIHVRRKMQSYSFGLENSAGIAASAGEIYPPYISTAHIPKYDSVAGMSSFVTSEDLRRGNRKYVTRFMRLGNECFLEEGQSFEEPLDALRLNLARWLKK